MYLDFEAIRSITVGSADTRETPDGVAFCKFTETGMKAWEKEPLPWLYDNARALSGVRFDFDTDTRRFAFTMSCPGHLDVYVDDLLCRHESDVTELDLALDGHLHHVTVYLPAHVPVPTVSRVWADDGARVTRHAFDTKILFVGDSITQGWESVHGGIRYDSLSYANVLSRRLHAESIVQGVGGAFFSPASVDDIPFDPDTVFVALGTNDFGANEDNLDRVYDMAADVLRRLGARYAGRRLFCISPIWSGRGDRQTAFDAYCEHLKDVIRRSPFTLVDGYTLVPHLPDFFADGWLHPNALGFEIYADRLLQAVEKV